VTDIKRRRILRWYNHNLSCSQPRTATTSNIFILFFSFDSITTVITRRVPGKILGRVPGRKKAEKRAEEKAGERTGKKTEGKAKKNISNSTWKRRNMSEANAGV
jgi:hypothetical protein